MANLASFVMVLLLFLGCGSGDKESKKSIDSVKQSIPSTIIINEIMTKNNHTLLDEDFSKFSDWIEIYNTTTKAIDISGYTLSDSLKTPRWVIPEGTILKEKSYMLFWADKEDNTNHTNFTLKSNKGEVALFDKNKKLLSGFSYAKQLADSTVNEEGYMRPTPWYENSKPLKSARKTQKPKFTTTSSFYSRPKQIQLHTKNDTNLYYTTDGSIPTIDSIPYTETFEVNKTTTIRVIAQKDDELISDVVTKTYFIGEHTTLPIISLVTDDKYLFNQHIGIYTIGTNGAKTPGCATGPKVANFYQDWKRPANIEFFDERKNLAFSQEVDIKISGSCSRVLPQKSLSITAKKKYGKKHISYKLFEDKDITEFKSFKLRTSGQDWSRTMLKDAFLQEVVKDTLDIDYQAYKPCVVFINGSYWGIHNIREKKNEDFLANNHTGVDTKKVDILNDFNGIKEGTNLEYKKMIQFIEEHDLSIEKNYQNLASMMDINNYIDYMIAEAYFTNDDWPYTNIRYWKENDASPKWRWILEDLDLALMSWRDGKEHVNMLEFLTQVDGENFRNPPWSTYLFRELITNNNFKANFKTLYLRYITDVFEIDRMKSILDTLSQKIELEIPRHATRWYNKGAFTFRDIYQWQENIDSLKNALTNRNNTIKDEVTNF